MFDDFRMLTWRDQDQYYTLDCVQTGLSRTSAVYRIGYCRRAYHSVGHGWKNVTIMVGSVEGDTPYRTYRTGVTTLHG